MGGGGLGLGLVWVGRGAKGWRRRKRRKKREKKFFKKKKSSVRKILVNGEEGKPG